MPPVSTRPGAYADCHAVMRSVRVRREADFASAREAVRFRKRCYELRKILSSRAEFGATEFDDLTIACTYPDGTVLPMGHLRGQVGYNGPAKLIFERRSLDNLSFTLGPDTGGEEETTDLDEEVSAAVAEARRSLFGDN